MKIYTYRSWKTKGIEVIEVNSLSLKRNRASDGVRVYKDFAETYDEAKVKLRKIIAAEIATQERKLKKLYDRAFEVI